MHVVAVYGWKQHTPELVQAIAEAQEKTAYEIQQRIIGGSPCVIASFADPGMAEQLAAEIGNRGIATMVVDAETVRAAVDYIHVYRFEIRDAALHIWTVEDDHAEVPYGRIRVMIAGTSTCTETVTKTVERKKISVGKTILAGGIPIPKTVKHTETSETLQHSRFLYMYVGRRPQPLIFSQDGMIYEGLGDAIQISHVLNFNYLISVLRKRSPGAVYDERLLKRIGLTRLLGPTIDPDTNLDLAAELLSRSLRDTFDPPATTEA
ncbi:hypothetical protein JXO52_06780 [bacterium]|nr:hypothetical protein [bacterium]